MKISGLCSFQGKLLFALSILFLGGVWRLPSASAKAGPKGDAYQVIALVNQVRASYGLPALQANSALMSAAQAHSDYQASIGSVTHSGKGGASPLQRAMAAGYGGGAKVYVSENIYGGNHASPSQAVNWWSVDSLHLQTMINPNATDAGAGVAQNGETVYYTLLVGYIAGAPGNAPISPAPAASTPAPSAVPYLPLITSTPNADGSVVHVVQPGQALWNIAAIYKVPLADLLALNGLTENSLIHPGDKILVRQAEITPTLDESPLPTATLTATAVLMSPTAPLNVMEPPIETPTLPIVPPTLEPIIAMDQATPAPAASTGTQRTAKMFPLLIAALFLSGGALILLGTFARPKS